MWRPCHVNKYMNPATQENALDQFVFASIVLARVFAPLINFFVVYSSVLLYLFVLCLCLGFAILTAEEYF